MKISGHTFVVTGGASGLGEATCRAIVEGGGKVAVFDLNAESGEALCTELGATQAAFFHCNVMKEESIDAAVAAAHAKFGALHGAVCCAGGQIGAGLTVNRRGEA
jgi:3-hydroxyacyl-CoA dehydrogenase/3-hydroxy-2-methylbutyryl-CoA dehydrogenase